MFVSCLPQHFGGKEIAFSFELLLVEMLLVEMLLVEMHIGWVEIEFAN